MNIFGRSQEAEAFETKTIAVTATPTLTRVIQNAYNSTDLKYDITSLTFTTLDNAGTGSKTISSTSVGEHIIVNFSGCLSMPANPDDGFGSYQFQFIYDDGKQAYEVETEIVDFFDPVSNEEFSCKWVIQKVAPTQIISAWTMTCPSTQLYTKTFKQTGRLETHVTNRIHSACTEGADMTMEVLFKSRNAAKPFSFTPTYFTIDVMRNVALTAGYT